MRWHSRTLWTMTFSLAAVVLVIAGLSVRQTSAGGDGTQTILARPATEPSGPTASLDRAVEPQPITGAQGEPISVQLPSGLATQLKAKAASAQNQPSWSLQATQLVNREDFNDPRWPKNSPNWDTFFNRKTLPGGGFVQCANTSGSGTHDCDIYWGAGYTPNPADPACPNAATTDPRLVGKTLAWPAFGGNDKRNPNCFFYPTYLDSWMVYGPVSLLDSKQLTLTYSRVMTVDQSANISGQPLVEGLVRYVLPDNSDTAYGFSLRQNGFAIETLEAVSTLAANGVSKPSSVFFIIRFLSDTNVDSLDGAFLDYAQIDKELDPAFTAAKRIAIPGASQGIQAAPQGGGSTGGSTIGNGGFEGGLANWSANSQNPPLNVKALPGQGFNGGTAATLNEKAVKCTGDFALRNGSNAILEQAINVPSGGAPKLRFRYRYFTEDFTKIINSSGADLKPGDPNFKQSDSFDVVLRSGGSGSSGDLIFRREFTDRELQGASAQVQNNYPAKNTNNCDNSGNRASYFEPSGNWVQQTIDLSAFQGRSVTLSFQLWNRIDNQLNTYVLLDDVELLPN